MCKRESDGYEGKVEYKQLNEERAQAMSGGDSHDDS